MSEDPVPCLVGPTGSGKSAVALDLARRTRGSVISADAFAVYRGMPILAAAPETPPDVPHHLVGVLDPSEAFSAARFVEEADPLVDAARGAGRTPWIVGGTGLYVRAWRKGFGAPVPRDAAFRRALEARAAAEGGEALHAELAQADPERARALHPNDRRRIVRALEIIRATGRPASAQRGEWAGPDRRAATVVGLRRTPEDLEARIARRTDAMFAAGVLDEARALLARPLSPEAAEVLGLDVLASVLAGERSEAEAREEIVRRTRRLARKQMTFFRGSPGLCWVEVAADDEPGTIAAAVLAALEGARRDRG